MLGRRDKGSGEEEATDGLRPKLADVASPSSSRNVESLLQRAKELVEPPAFNAAVYNDDDEDYRDMEDEMGFLNYEDVEEGPVGADEDQEWRPPALSPTLHALDLCVPEGGLQEHHFGRLQYPGASSPKPKQAFAVAPEPANAFAEFLTSDPDERVLLELSAQLESLGLAIDESGSLAPTDEESEDTLRVLEEDVMNIFFKSARDQGMTVADMKDGIRERVLLYLMDAAKARVRERERLEQMMEEAKERPSGSSGRLSQQLVSELDVHQRVAGKLSGSGSEYGSPGIAAFSGVNGAGAAGDSRGFLPPPEMPVSPLPPPPPALSPPSTTARGAIDVDDLEVESLEHGEDFDDGSSEGDGEEESTGKSEGGDN